MEPKMIETLIDKCKANIAPTFPHGYCYLSSEEASALAPLIAQGFAEIGPVTPNGVPARPTDAAVKWLAEANAAPHHVPQPAMSPSQTVVSHSGPYGVTIDDGIPPPQTQRKRGRPGGDGPTAVERWGLDKLVVNQSVYIGQEYSPTLDMPVHRALSSMVSNARRSLFPRNFVIAAVDETSMGRGVGARIWRIADQEGDAPARKPRAERKSKNAAQPAPPPVAAVQPPPQAPQGGFAAFAPPPPAAPQAFDPGGPAAPTFGGFGGPPPFQNG